ncbi:anti-sigma factor family protein [Streptomyces boninensis]|uniref:anti-sigma factor family protein n=1 Tax=Streptomyces boninensis TaxID=2039455 RepID=UPI003B214649
MTSEAHTSASSDGHPEVADISALAEGLLPAEQSSAVRAHLAECEICADIEMSLDEIRGLLGDLPSPAAMPEDVATRIDAALAAEALVSRETATAPDDVSRETDAGPSSVSRETVTPLTAGRRRQRGRGPRIVLSLAASVAVIAGGVWLGSLAIDSGAGGDNASKAQDAGGGAEKAAPGESSAGSVSREELGDKVTALLADPGNQTLEGGGDATLKGTPETGEPKTKDERRPAVVPTCIRDLISRAEKPVAVDESVMRGGQVYVVVLPNVTDRAQVDAYAVSATCVTAPGSPSELLQKSTYPRP